MLQRGVPDRGVGGFGGQRRAGVKAPEVGAGERGVEFGRRVAVVAVEGAGRDEKDSEVKVAGGMGAPSPIIVA